MTQTPPPNHPPTYTESSPPPGSSMETYHTVADTVGLVPNLRIKDNLLQAGIIIIALLISVSIGWLNGGLVGVLIGAIAGLIAGTLISGCILMVLGWVRALNRRK